MGSPKSPQKDSRRKSHAYFSGLFHSSSKAPKKAKQQLFADIHRFQETEFARKHFANCRRGFFKRKLPMKEFLVWSKEPIDHPLLTDVRGIEKYAHKISKDILKFMGDHKTQHQDQHGMDILVLGRRHAETRDEIILQLCKQVTDNPENESCLRGWGLLGLCLFSFTPTVDLEPHLKTIFEVYENHSSEAISSFARYCIARLGRPTHRETRQVTFEELRTCHEAIYKANPFNCTIDELILLEKKVPGAPDAVPSFLVELVDNLKACGGMEAEGVFRIAPDSDDFETLKLGVIKGEVQLSTIEDPHMLAGLMKQFLRELVVPVVPFANYMSCATARSNPTRCKEAFDALPLSHQVVLRYILGFIRELSQPIYQQQTKMDSRSLSLVLAPNILRCPSLDPMEVFARSQDETDFIVTLVNAGV